MINSDGQSEPGRKRMTLRGKLARLGLAVLFSIFGSELALRLIWHNPYRRESPDELLVVPIQHPGRDFIYDRSRISTNPAKVKFRVDDRSYILPSHQYDKADVTIAFLGGSTTECFAVDEPLRFPALVSTLLAKRGLKVNTLNGGRSYNTVHDGLNALINHVIDDRPDVVVFMEAASDHGVLSSTGSYRSRMGETASFRSMMRWPMQKATSLSSLAAVFRVWATVEGRFDQVVRKKGPLPEEEFVRRLRAFARVSRAFGTTPVLMTQPDARARNELTPAWADSEHQERFNELIRKVGLEEGVVVIDLVRHFIDSVPGWDKPMAYFYDGIHVNDLGSQEEASYISQRLAETVLAPKLAGNQGELPEKECPRRRGRGRCHRHRALLAGSDAIEKLRPNPLRLDASTLVTAE